MSTTTPVAEESGPQFEAKIGREGDLVALEIGNVVATMTPDQADWIASLLRAVAAEVRAVSQ